MPLPSHMTAIAIKAPGGPEVLVPEERPVPQPAASEILVKVAAAGVNRPDVMQRKGQYPPPPGAPVWLGEAGDIRLVGLREGSLVLDVTARPLAEIAPGAFPTGGGETAFDLLMNAIDDALEGFPGWVLQGFRLQSLRRILNEVVQAFVSSSALEGICNRGTRPSSLGQIDNARSVSLAEPGCGIELDAADIIGGMASSVDHWSPPFGG